MQALSCEQPLPPLAVALTGNLNLPLAALAICQGSPRLTIASTTGGWGSGLEAGAHDCLVSKSL